MRPTLRRLPAIALTLAGVAVAQAPSLDYAQWRGGDRDGGTAAFARPTTWPAALTRAWSVDVGTGYSTPLLVGETAYVFTRRDGNEVLTAVDAGAGTTRWRTSYMAPYSVNDAAARHGAGPKATPLFYRGRIFTMGISGIVTAFDAKTGGRIWQTPPPNEAAIYGAASSPLGEADLVILHPGNYGPLTAFDAPTGKIAWTAADGGLFASPIAATLDGVRQIVSVTQTSIVGVALDGTVLWKYPFQNNGAGTPVIHDGTVIVGGLDLGFVAVRPAKSGGGWTVAKMWDTKAASTYFGSPVVVADAIYGLSDKASGQFFALDAASGKTLWLGAPRTADYASVEKSGDLVFLLKNDGELIVAQASRTSFQPLKTYTVSTSATWAHPVISGQRVLIKDTNTLTLWTIH